MRRVMVALTMTVAALIFGGCNRDKTQADIEVTADLQHHCILRALDRAFGHNGMHDIYWRYRGGKPITVVFDGFPHSTYPNQFRKHQLSRITIEEAELRIEAKEEISFMRLMFHDRRPDGEIVVEIGTHVYYKDSKRDLFSRAHGEWISIEFKPTDGELDNGTVRMRSIE